MLPPPPGSTLFPYTTLFRSPRRGPRQARRRYSPAKHHRTRRRSVSCPRERTACRRVRWCFARSEEHTSELQSRFDLVCRLLLEKKKVIDRKLRALSRASCVV